MMSEAILVTGCSFNIFEHELWSKFFNKLRPSFKLPSRKIIGNKYVDEFYAETKHEIDRNLATKKVLHLQCDGWSNIRNEGIMNFIINDPEPVFAKFVQTGSERHTAEYIEREVEAVVEQYGPEKFSTIIGDNAKNFQKALSNVATKYPNIIPLRCIAHTLNLLCQDILKINCVDNLITSTNEIINHIRGSQVLNSLLKKKRLKQYVKTRWCTMEKSLKSLIDAKFQLQSLTIHPKAIMLKNDVKMKLKDENFWKDIKYIRDLFDPICKLITKVEGDQLYIHTIIDELNSLQTSCFEILNNSHPAPMFVKQINAGKNKTSKAMAKNPDVDYISELKKAIMERKDAIIQPIHYAAVLLNPANMGNSLQDDGIMKGMAFISKFVNDRDKIEKTGTYISHNFAYFLLDNLII